MKEGEVGKEGTEEKIRGTKFLSSPRMTHFVLEGVAHHRYCAKIFKASLLRTQSHFPEGVR